MFPKIVVITPKSSILIGFSIISHPFWGTPIFGNTHMFPKQFRNLPTWKESCSNNSPRPKPGFFDGHQDAAWLPVANRPFAAQMEHLENRWLENCHGFLVNTMKMVDFCDGFVSLTGMVALLVVGPTGNIGTAKNGDMQIKCWNVISVFFE